LGDQTIGAAERLNRSNKELVTSINLGTGETTSQKKKGEDREKDTPELLGKSRPPRHRRLRFAKDPAIKNEVNLVGKNCSTSENQGERKCKGVVNKEVRGATSQRRRERTETCRAK